MNLFCYFRFLYHIFLCYVPFIPVITCWERAARLDLLCIVFPFVFVIFLYGAQGQVRYLIVLLL